MLNVLGNVRGPTKVQRCWTVLGCNWPPIVIEAVDPYGIPLLGIVGEGYNFSFSISNIELDLLLPTKEIGNVLLFSLIYFIYRTSFYYAQV